MIHSSFHLSDPCQAIIICFNTILTDFKSHQIHNDRDKIYLAGSTVNDSLDAHGDVFSNGVSIVVIVVDSIRCLTFWSTSISMLTTSGDPGLDLAVLETTKQSIFQKLCVMVYYKIIYFKDVKFYF